jgi:hypothetical protein
MLFFFVTFSNNCCYSVNGTASGCLVAEIVLMVSLLHLITQIVMIIVEVSNSHARTSVPQAGSELT